jgi:hypothetical protein
MHGGAVVTVYNQIPHTKEIKMILHELPVLDTLIAYLEQQQHDDVADVFAAGRGTTREQLITDLRSEKLKLDQIRDDLYVINEPFRMPEYVPFYDPDKPDKPYVRRYTDVELEPFLKQLDLTAAAERAAPREKVEANAAAVRAAAARAKAVEAEAAAARAKAVEAEAEANTAASGPEANAAAVRAAAARAAARAAAVRAEVAVLAADQAEDHALKWARWIEKKNAQP